MEATTASCAVEEAQQAPSPTSHAGIKREFETTPQEEPAKRHASEVAVSNVQDRRICFEWLNHGSCNRGASCKFRHLEPNHPDAIMDRVRTGHINKLVGTLPVEKVRIASRNGLA